MGMNFLAASIQATIGVAACVGLAGAAWAQTPSLVTNSFITMCAEGRGNAEHALAQARADGWDQLPDGLIPSLGLPFTERQAWMSPDSSNTMMLIVGQFDMPANDAAIHMTTCGVVAQPVEQGRAIAPDPHEAFTDWIDMAPDPRFTNAETTAFAFTTEGDERRGLHGLSDMAVTQAVAAGRVTVIMLMGRGTDRVMLYVAPSL